MQVNKYSGGLLHNNLLERKHGGPSNFEEIESDCGSKSIYVRTEFIWSS